MAKYYLGRKDVAERIGVKAPTLSRYTLPDPDVYIGSGRYATRGWLPETIVKWNAERPGCILISVMRLVVESFMQNELSRDTTVTFWRSRLMKGTLLILKSELFPKRIAEVLPYSMLM
ncbi:MAG: hypothetical protein Q4P66_04870 [Actinomycetaceae bacterium]|nr:hypothetical protein [Actinomycetaceae bacterium]MDO5746976.1 hypothetical protein [Actinomycetaceae bacterium]